MRFLIETKIHATDPKNASAIPETACHVVREAKSGSVKQLQFSSDVEAVGKYQLVTSTRNS